MSRRTDDFVDYLLMLIMFVLGIGAFMALGVAALMILGWP